MICYYKLYEMRNKVFLFYIYIVFIEILQVSVQNKIIAENLKINCTIFYKHNVLS